jgi:hypothetical protein
MQIRRNADLAVALLQDLLVNVLEGSTGYLVTIAKQFEEEPCMTRCKGALKPIAWLMCSFLLTVEILIQSARILKTDSSNVFSPRLLRTLPDLKKNLGVSIMINAKAVSLMLRF